MTALGVFFIAAAYGAVAWIGWRRDAVHTMAPGSKLRFVKTNTCLAAAFALVGIVVLIGDTR